MSRENPHGCENKNPCVLNKKNYGVNPVQPKKRG